ncbi:hypothetical protein MMC09_001121 [Bachmanniomyces sp. S44760]|nr:hypothetical protein [Bachmanniomyces sp. S44760]
MHENGEQMEYDIVIAGGGTAACVIAGRLARADPDLSILIIEGGKNNLDDPTVRNPAIYLSHLAPTSQTALFYKANVSQHLGGREAIVPCGGILGGGSSINFMMYTRGQACDYDSWNTKGWGYENLLPYMKKLETYDVDDPEADKSVHGYDGPIHVSRGTHAPKGPEDDFLASAKALGIPEITDLQDFKSCEGFSRWAKYISRDGLRQDAAHTYIHPLMSSGAAPNLHLQLESKVIRILFDSSKRATGVEFQHTGSYAPSISLSKPTTKQARARKMVIIASGALGTPSILERSGVGNKDLLQKLDIPIISDLPGVGENYQDHHLILYPYKTSLRPDETIDGILSGKVDFAKAVESKDKMLGWNAIDMCSKLRLSDPEVQSLGPEFSSLWGRDFAHQPSKPFMLMGVISSFLGDHSTLPPPDEQAEGSTTTTEKESQQYATMGAYTAYPYSRGSIHITTRDLSAPASFDTGFLSDPQGADLKAQVWAYKKQRELYRRTNAYRGELALGHPEFPPGSNAALHTGALSSAGGKGFKTISDRKAIPPIEYSAADDHAIESHVRNNLNTTWHSMGTCKMAPREQGGVVDPLLNVYGTQGLKLADLSIAPENVGANTNNTALLVGEKAADVILGELGVGGGEGRSACKV